MLDAANRTENMKPDPMLTRKLKALQRIANAKQRGDREGQQKAQNEMDRLMRGIMPIKKEEIP